MPKDFKILRKAESHKFTFKLNLRKKLVNRYIWRTVNRYIWRTALYGAETWDNSEDRSETPRKFWNVVLVTDWDQLDQSSEKWRSVTKNQGAEEYPTYNKKTED